MTSQTPNHTQPIHDRPVVDIDLPDISGSKYNTGYGTHHYTSPNTQANLETVYESLKNGQTPSSSQAMRKYPNWSIPEAPIQMAEIKRIFATLEKRFGFQRDSVENMLDHLLTMLDSRSARMTPNQALWSLHSDYIGGEHANYRKWYFAAQLDLDDRQAAINTPTGLLLEEAKREWRERMENMTNQDRVRQLALYLLIWGEAATMRYAPELLCFIFHLADDYHSDREMAPGTFLDTIILPLYRFSRNQSYAVVNGRHTRLEKDHNKIVGYDDINQVFWSRATMGQLRLKNTMLLLKDIPRHERYTAIPTIDWESVLKKTFYESRSWLHLFTNFSRIWIMHTATFWYYMAANAEFLYTSDARKEMPVKLSVVALGGLVAVLLLAGATLAEFMYLPPTSQNIFILLSRFAILGLLAALHVGASVYVLWFDRTSFLATIIAACQLGFGVIVSIWLSTVPPANLFRRRRSSSQLASRTFTASFPDMSSDERWLSILLWTCVFTCKFLETYFFLALSFRSALLSVSSLRLSTCGTDALLGRWLCAAMPVLTGIVMFIIELVLFFLDTYLWYVIWNTVFSVSQAIRMGISIMTSWKTLFARLPNRLYTKVFSTAGLGTTFLRETACSQMWNAIVIAMYREHLLSINNLELLLYHVHTNDDQTTELRAPPFFDPESDTKKEDCFPAHSEAERRLSFFAQSLSTDIQEPCPVQQMPIFTVLTPHYAEKMLLSLREIIREEDPSSQVTLLEYLKRLHPAEWDNFVKDTIFLADEESDQTEDKQKEKQDNKDLPFYCIGFKSSAPEYTLRTRVWASLRAQTLYRTMNGFMNYARALKILHRIEHPEQAQANDEQYLEYIAHQKFRYLVAMQRYAHFSAEENENCEFILREYPQIQIAYIDQEPADEGDGEPKYYSALIDGNCEHMPNGKRKPRYRIRLPGNPILGDGKSDNQNHAIIFYRGEYLQLVDANQDNYLEECLKIRSVFGEFEQDTPSDERDIYALSSHNSKPAAPVAIVGAREYIFSENIGVLGDIAAGKEQTFGTLTQRIMAKTGGRLHYGHPDFLNAVFMTTRGGVSKAQRGLHLNEDIYAGMNALSRGGRIKHTEYIQCGKGRDLGFCSILNFTTKIGNGMGEQMLSREYYYLGTQLPIDRFLTFYYAHPGFHLNNIMIILAIQLFLFGMMLVGTLGSSLPRCISAVNCNDIEPVYEWLQRCIISIVLVFFIAFLPLFLQELTERGTWRSVTRLVKQLASLSFMFEVFVNQIYAYSVLSNLSFGGAQYIATGRGFATSRLPFALLYERFANPSIYLGARSIFMLTFVTMTLRMPHLLYFWISILSLVISPFIFNPHQFVFSDFIIDYREFLRWLSRQNSANTWISFCRQSRSQITGTKRKEKNLTAGNNVHHRARLSSIFASQVILPFIQAFICLVSFMFLKSQETPNQSALVRALCRIAITTFGPVIWNGVMLLVLQLTLVIMTAIYTPKQPFGHRTAAIAHGLSIAGLIFFLEAFWWLENYETRSTMLGLLTVTTFQRFLFKSFVALFLTRELHSDISNEAWWTAQWQSSHALSHAPREYLCKIVEMSLFTADFFLGHMILFVLFPLTLIPGADRVHSMMLLWLRPSQQMRPPVLFTKQRERRRRILITYGPLFTFILLTFALLLYLPPYLVPATTRWNTPLNVL